MKKRLQTRFIGERPLSPRKVRANEDTSYASQVFLTCKKKLKTSIQVRACLSAAYAVRAHARPGAHQCFETSFKCRRQSSAHDTSLGATLPCPLAYNQLGIVCLAVTLGPAAHRLSI